MDSLLAYYRGIGKEETFHDELEYLCFRHLLYARQTVHGMVNVEQFAGVSVKIGAYLGMNARWALAACTRLGILARHAIHVG